MTDFDLQHILESYSTPAADDPLHLNPRFADLLRLLGLDRRFVAAEGAHLFDDAGVRYLDAVGGFASLSFGRNHPVILDALRQAMHRRCRHVVDLGTEPGRDTRRTLLCVL